jgi:uncharacterized membrane protein (UPF0136 family)
MAAPPAPPTLVTRLPTGTTHLTYTMALLTGAGGVAGYASSRSTRSLFGGVAIGALFAYSAFTIQSGEETKGFRLGAISSVGLAAVMGKRFHSTGKIVPSGLLCGLGLASAAYHINKAREWGELD